MNFVSLLIFFPTVLFKDLQGRDRVKADQTCPKNCKPLIEETIHCDENTGECSEGCNTGFYGTTCEKFCQCRGGPCDFFRGTCIDDSTVKPDPPGNVFLTEEYNTYNKTVISLVVCCLILLILVLVLLVLIGKKKILRICERWNPLCGLEEENNASGREQNGQDSADSQRSQRSYIPLLHGSTDQTLTDFQKELGKKLGVYFLEPEDPNQEPVFLSCVFMKFDHNRVNRKNAHVDRDNVLSNRTIREPNKEFPISFKTFEGTTSLAPFFPFDSPTYWEVNTKVYLKKELADVDLLLSIGFCKESQRDQWYQVGVGDHCYSLKVSPCSDRIFTKIYKKKEDGGFKSKTVLKNKVSESGLLHYGILVDSGKGIIIFFDVSESKPLVRCDSVVFNEIGPDGPMWPMFGVHSGSSADVSMKLITRGDIVMTPEKSKMILNALQSV